MPISDAVAVPAQALLRTRTVDQHVRGVRHGPRSRDPEPDISVLMDKLTELNLVLREYGKVDDESVSGKLIEFRRQLANMKALVQPLQLQLYVADGNQHLRVMARDLRDEKFDNRKVMVKEWSAWVLTGDAK